MCERRGRQWGDLLLLPRSRQWPMPSLLSRLATTHALSLATQVLKILNADRPEKVVKELFKHLAEAGAGGKRGKGKH